MDFNHFIDFCGRDPNKARNKPSNTRGEVLDTTNSMVRDARLTTAREAVEALFSALNELDAATVVAFADTAAASADGRVFRCACR